jgi:predicted metal-dependent hydrolase
LSSTKYSSDNDSKAEQQQSKETFQYGNKIVNYTLIKSKRRKTSEIIVDKNSNIILRVPFEKTTSEIEQILNDKIKWAIIKQKEYQKEISDIIKPTYENNSTIPYLGKNYVLHVVYYDDVNNNNSDSYKKQNEKIDYMNDKFIAYIYKNTIEKNTTDNNNIPTMNQTEKISRLYNDWLLSEANKLFIEKVNNYKKLVDVIPNKIVIKTLRNRWGSLTKEGNIHLNFHLIKASEDIIDYIIIHELCHLRIEGHSHQFWNYLKQFVPDYEKMIKYLERNSASILS